MPVAQNASYAAPKMINGKTISKIIQSLASALRVPLARGYTLQTSSYESEMY